MTVAARNTKHADPVDKLCIDLKHNNGLVARLRRASDPDEVLGLEAVVRLADSLAGTDLDRGVDHDEFAAALAILLAQKMTDRDDRSGKASLAACLGMKHNDRRRLSELRFARLIHARDIDSRLRQLRRALGMLNAPVSARAIAQGWQDLNSTKGRHRFARAYFSASDMPATATDIASVIVNEQESTP